MKPLSIKNLTKRYGKLVAVEALSFDIEEGEIFGLLGPNGAGKTTIISTIMTLEAPTEGEISLFGIDTLQNPRLAKRQVGWVPQELINHGFFNVEEVARFHGAYFGKRIDPAYFRHLMERLHLWHHRKKKVAQLSGGMKRRLLILKALLHRPRLLLLDEPTAGVDVELRALLWNFVEELRNEGISVLLTTHYLEEAERLCDRVGIIDHGRLRHVDRTGKLIERYSRKGVTLTLKTPPRLPPHPYLKRQEGRQLYCQVPNEMPLCDLAIALGLPLSEVVDIDVKRGNLEEVMHTVLKEEKR